MFLSEEWCKGGSSAFAVDLYEFLCAKNEKVENRIDFPSALRYNETELTNIRGGLHMYTAKCRIYLCR